MARVIDPKVELIDYGPKLINREGKLVTPDEVICAAAGITFKKSRSLHNDLVNGAASEEEKQGVMKKIIQSAGRGHASMTTSVNLWFSVEGDCSKHPDAIFTGAPHLSALMGSSRRVPITQESVIIPKSIVGNPQARNLYVEQSEANIAAYEQLIENGVPKQEAAKIVQYGHRGSGFFDMPLETLISFDRYFEGNPDVPEEGREIVRQLKQHVKENGMGILFESRRAAARPGYLVNDIFNTRTNEATDLIDSTPGVLSHPVVLRVDADMSPEFERRVQEYLKTRRKLLGAEVEELIRNEQIGELENLYSDFNQEFRAKTGVNSPERVWGEVKRHRTLRQVAEPHTHAIERAKSFFEENPEPRLEDQGYVQGFLEVCSFPGNAMKNPESAKLWVERFQKSVKTYEELVKQGIPSSDAAYVLPRGLKQVVIKDHDLSSVAGLYMPVRLCKTAEPEMQALSYAERDEIINHEGFPQTLIPLIAPKCHAAGYCLETKPCKRVRDAVPGYGSQHGEIEAARESNIRKAIGS